ncbi:unnamed protein product [Tetraodon nigroviridis]|uniref:(spotted green pufferfish) hypothetical protein n=1 Tax=Tetraodon nigroviridis TaxID=99883 RepID=Q4SD62_TETNG|nr:unnamed protein product [Tetraodon nigroviridis]
MGTGSQEIVSYNQNTSALFLELLLQAKPLQMERIIASPSQSQSALSDQSSGLPSSHTFQERSGSSPLCVYRHVQSGQYSLSRLCPKTPSAGYWKM